MKYSKAERAEWAAVRNNVTRQGVKVRDWKGAVHEVGDKCGKHGAVVKTGGKNSR